MPFLGWGLGLLKMLLWTWSLGFPLMLLWTNLFLFCPSFWCLHPHFLYGQTTADRDQVACVWSHCCWGWRYNCEQRHCGYKSLAVKVFTLLVASLFLRVEWYLAQSRHLQSVALIYRGAQWWAPALCTSPESVLAQWCLLLLICESRDVAILQLETAGEIADLLVINLASGKALQRWYWHLRYGPNADIYWLGGQDSGSKRRFIRKINIKARWGWHHCQGNRV